MMVAGKTVVEKRFEAYILLSRGVLFLRKSISLTLLKASDRLMR
jgi:hypothetical protein